MNCVKYVAEEKAKEKRSSERRERRKERYEAKEGGDKDLKFHGGDRGRPLVENLGSSSSAGIREIEAPNPWSYPPAPHEPSPANHNYHQTPHIVSVEEREKAQSKQTQAWEPAAGNHKGESLSYHENTHSPSAEERETGKGMNESTGVSGGERGRADREYKS